MSPYAAHHAPIDRAPNVHGNADWVWRRLMLRHLALLNLGVWVLIGLHVGRALA